MASGGVLAAAGCPYFRSTILSFLVPSFVPLIQSNARARWQHPGMTRPAGRSFSSETKPAAESHLVGDDGPGEPTLGSPSNSDSSAEEVPWYLRVDAPRHGDITEPPVLPEAPEGSPAIVRSLLDYAANEMGLNDISLLDLRALEQESAFGPNLIMLFGTARGDRHLHESTIELMRWLRAEHRVRAVADGLLHSAKRQLTMKRNAKRAALMRGIGGDMSDGISTDWICVNLGTLHRDLQETTRTAEDGRVTGFGVRPSGCSIVFQVLTRIRRARMDLESIWQGQLRRQALRAERLERAEPSPEPSSPQLHPLEKAILSNDSSRGVAASSQSIKYLSKYLPGQVRHFSTNPGMVTTNIDTPPPSPFSPHSLAFDGQQKLNALNLLQMHFLGLSAKDARAAFDSATVEGISTVAMRHLQPEQTWAFRLSMETRARQVGGKRLLSGDTVRDLVKELRTSGITVKRDQCMWLLFCVYAQPEPMLDERTALAAQVLEHLHLQGQPLIANDVVVSVIEATSLSRTPDDEESALQDGLEDLMLQMKLPCMDEPLLVRLMDAYARQKRWDKFWETWRTPPRFLRPRSGALYSHLYRRMASTRSPSLCADALRRCFPEMLNEDPIVRPVGRVRQALLACIRVADEEAEQLAQTVPDNPKGFEKGLLREFVRLVKALNAWEDDSGADV